MAWPRLQDVTTLMFAVADGLATFDFYESDVNQFDVSHSPEPLDKPFTQNLPTPRNLEDEARNHTRSLKTSEFSSLHPHLSPETPRKL